MTDRDSAAFQACIALSDVVRVFLLQNRKTLDVLDSAGVWSSEVGLDALRDASEKAVAARIARVEAARGEATR